MIDLHTHTTASDGRCTPEELVDRAAAAGVRVLSVTDHDTLAGTARARQAAALYGIEFVPGVEITAMAEGRDVHILGYFLDEESGELESFLADQRRHRIDRVREIVDRLASFGIAVDGDAIVRDALENPSRSVGRPAIARALVAGRHVESVREAFDRWLSRGQPAYVPRRAAAPSEVFQRIHAAGGIASVAHPGLLDRDPWLPAFAAAGVDALEAYHTDHDDLAVAKYLRFARELGVGVSGGSDYHASDSHGGGGPGSVVLPQPAYDELKRRATSRATASGRVASS
jgi:3',5'-nucleoside bisphosphate phosphatase